MNNQIKVFFVIYMLFSVSCYSQNKNQSKIDIIDLSIEAPLAIKCENFNNYFKDEIKNIKLNKVDVIKIFKMVSILKPIDIKPYLDTRYQGQLYYKNKKYCFCGDSASIKINDKYYLTSPELISFFEMLVNQ